MKEGYYWEVFDTNSDSLFSDHRFYVETSKQAVQQYCKQKGITKKIKRAKMGSVISTYMKQENGIVYRSKKKKNVYYDFTP